MNEFKIKVGVFIPKNKYRIGHYSYRSSDTLKIICNDFHEAYERGINLLNNVTKNKKGDTYRLCILGCGHKFYYDIKV